MAPIPIDVDLMTEHTGPLILANCTLSLARHRREKMRLSDWADMAPKINTPPFRVLPMYNKLTLGRCGRQLPPDDLPDLVVRGQVQAKELNLN